MRNIDKSVMVYQEIVEELKVEITQLEEDKRELRREYQENPNDEQVRERLKEVQKDIITLKEELEGYKTGELVI